MGTHFLKMGSLLKNFGAHFLGSLLIFRFSDLPGGCTVVCIICGLKAARHDISYLDVFFLFFFAVRAV